MRDWVSLLWLTTALCLATALDDCEIGHVRCGDQCGGACQCGDHWFNWNNTESWCCVGDSSCTVTGPGGWDITVTCDTGKLQLLSQPCHGRCNTHLGNPLRGARSHLLCRSGDQCVREGVTEGDLCQGVPRCDDKLDIELCKLDEWRGKSCLNTDSIRCDGSIPGQCVHTKLLGDKRYDCLDRSDETHGEKNEVELDWGQLEECQFFGAPGMKCGEDCFPYYFCCNTIYALTCPQLGNLSTSDPIFCGNSTFWQGKSCAGVAGGRRCNGTRPGQCSNSITPCADRSDQVYRLPSYCLDPALLVYNTHTHTHCREHCEECTTEGAVMCYSGECIIQVARGGGV